MGSKLLSIGSPFLNFFSVFHIEEFFSVSERDKVKLFKISATNLNEPSPMGLRVVGIVPCTCQCWHGPKAPKLSTVSSSARANALPYVINTNTASPSCAECKRKLDQEQQQIQFQQHHLNCAFNTQQSQQHQHLPHCLSMQCSSLLNPSNAATNNQLYNVPPPSLIPSILPAVLQTGQNANVSTKFLLTSTNTAPSNAVLTTGMLCHY